MSFAPNSEDLSLSPFSRGLIRAGYISLPQIHQALREAEQSGRPLPTVVEAIIGESLPQELLRQYRTQHRFTLKILHGVEFLDLDRDPLDFAVIATLIDRYLPWALCQDHQLIPLRRSDSHPSTLIIGMVHLDHIDAHNQLHHHLTRRDIPYQRWGITAEDYQQLLAQYLQQYPQPGTPANQNPTVVDVTEIFEEPPLPMSNPTPAADPKPPSPEKENPVTALVNKILILGLREKASEIHLDPQETKLVVTMRQNGNLRPLVDPLPKDMIPAVIKRLKEMVGLDLAQTEIPQKAKLRKSYGGQPVYFFVHTLPTFYGEKILVRLVESLPQLPEFSDLSADPADQTAFELFIPGISGLVLISAPANGGKSKTIEALLRQQLKQNRTVGTVEDPIRRAFSGINQVEVNVLQGLSYRSALQSLAAQSIDVIAIDLIEEEETAQAAIAAVEQGRLVIAGVHAKSVSTAIAQLQTWIKPALLAEHLRGVINQRLLRRICPTCRLSHQPEVEEMEKLGLTPAQRRSSQFYRANSLSPDLVQELHLKGRLCRQCHGVGYHGQVAVYEFVPVTLPLRQLLAQSPEPLQVQQHLSQDGHVTLTRRALEQVLQSNTTLEELLRLFPHALDELSLLPPVTSPGLPPDFSQKFAHLETSLNQLSQAFESLKESLYPATPDPTPPSHDLDLLPELLALEELSKSAPESEQDEIDPKEATLVGRPEGWGNFLEEIDPKEATYVSDFNPAEDQNATVISPFRTEVDPW